MSVPAFLLVGQAAPHGARAPSITEGFGQPGKRAEGCSWPGCLGSFQRKFNAASVLLLTGKQLSIVKADHYCILFPCVLIWNFVLNNVNRTSLPFQLVNLVNSKPKWPKKCTDWEAEGKTVHICTKGVALFSARPGQNPSFGVVCPQLEDVAKEYPAVPGISPLK